MALSHPITLHVEAPYGRVAAFLADKVNFAKWAAIDPQTYRPLVNGDWAGEVRFGGVRHVRFAPPNDDGVFDHAVFRPGDELLWMPMRIRAEGEGTRLDFTFIQRPGMSDDAFRSTLEWVQIDFLTLKSLLEAREAGR